MAELFPTRTRGTGVALSYNISVPIFGGLGPFFAALLIQLTGDRHAPSFYLMLTALISLAALVAVRSRLYLGELGLQGAILQPARSAVRFVALKRCGWY